jgi:hypothetical protein
MITKHRYNIMISSLTLDLKYRLCKAKQIIRALHVRHRKEYAYVYSSSSILHLIEINSNEWVSYWQKVNSVPIHWTFVGEYGGAASPISTSNNHLLVELWI